MGITMQIYNTYICPSSNALMDIGSSAKQWKDLYIDGLAYIDALGQDLSANGFDISGIDTLTATTSTIGTLSITNSLDISTKNIITDTSTGTKIGTASTQKLGFWGATPVVQPLKISDPTESGASLDTAIEAIIDALEAVGILASS